jgi:hypothetical protein
MTSIEIACVALNARPLRSRRAFLALADLSERSSSTVRRARTTAKAAVDNRKEPRDGWRYVHCEGDIEREPVGDEVFTLISRKGDWEFCSTPLFRSSGGIRFVKPRPNGPWDIVELSEEQFDDQLESGERQGWVTWIRRARGARS